jgi:hypothetical protein
MKLPSRHCFRFWMTPVSSRVLNDLVDSDRTAQRDPIPNQPRVMKVLRMMKANPIIFKEESMSRTKQERTRRSFFCLGSKYSESAP